MAGLAPFYVGCWTVNLRAAWKIFPAWQNFPQVTPAAADTKPVVCLWAEPADTSALQLETNEFAIEVPCQETFTVLSSNFAIRHSIGVI
jgi:hypothetical protein